MLVHISTNYPYKSLLSMFLTNHRNIYIMWIFWSFFTHATIWAEIKKCWFPLLLNLVLHIALALACRAIFCITLPFWVKYISLVEHMALCCCYDGCCKLWWTLYRRWQSHGQDRICLCTLYGVIKFLWKEHHQLIRVGGFYYTFC